MNKFFIYMFILTLSIQSLNIFCDENSKSKHPSCEHTKAEKASVLITNNFTNALYNLSRSIGNNEAMKYYQGQVDAYYVCLHIIEDEFELVED